MKNKYLYALIVIYIILHVISIVNDDKILNPDDFTVKEKLCMSK